MTQEENQENQRPSPLLNDEEFVTIMEHEYQDLGRPQNEIAHKRLWNALESDLFSSNPGHEPGLDSQISRTISESLVNIVSVAAAAVLLLSIVPLFSDNRLYSVDRIKGIGDFPLVNISAFVVKDDGELQAASGQLGRGTTLVFKIDTPKPVAVALAMSKADKPPQVRFRTDIMTSGAGQLLTDDGRVYGYELEVGDRQLKICAIASENEKSLSRRLRLIARVWNSLPDASCVMINSK
jgi:hypothetical protein